MSSIPHSDSSSGAKPGKAGGSAGTLPNGTIGRILANPCCSLPPPLLTFEPPEERLSKQRQRYADYKSGKLKLSGQEAIELRQEISFLSEIVNPGPQMWSALDASEQAYLDQRAALQRRQANNLGIAGAGPVFGFLPLLCRLFGAPEAVVEAAGELNLKVGAAFWAGKQWKEKGLDPRWQIDSYNAQRAKEAEKARDGVVVERRRR